MPGDARPAYQRLAEDLRAEIRAGRLQPDDKVPSVRQLAEKYGVAQMTATHALRLLQSEGLTYTIVGRGSFVHPSAGAVVNPPNDPLTALRERVEGLEKRVEALELRQDSE
jgi:DNA-binding GntR family transcriptional regulator